MSSEIQLDIKNQYNNALKAIKSSRLIDAEAILAQCIAQDEKFISAWLQLGLVWVKMGRDSDASDAFRMVLSIDENNVDAMHNLGLSLIKQGNIDEGMKFMDRACIISNDIKMAINLGEIYRKQKNYQKSSFFFLKAYQKDNKDPEIIKSLATSLFFDGDTPRAIQLIIGLILRFPNNSSYKRLFSELCNKWAPEEFSKDLKNVIEICLKEDNLRHRNIAVVWLILLMIDPKFESFIKFPHLSINEQNIKDISPILKSPFLCLGLQRVIASNFAIENILTHIRRNFLINWKNTNDWSIGDLEFITSLAMQCWHNDFIYYENAEEKNALKDLNNELRNKLENCNGKIDNDTAKILALSCCYQPLYEITSNIDSFKFTSQVKNIIAPLIKVQFTNPKEESELIPKIQSFTNIEDETSKAVQTMYESRPYPRWTSINLMKQSDVITNISNDIEALVAGCGTGQEPCFLTAILPNAKVTAIDLSRTSIAYGMRMAKQFKLLSQINFLHGDLMKVGELNKKFDYVASSGVLHHLKDPEKGLAAILTTMKDNGRLSLSLYSKIARDLILNPASEYINEKGYTSSLDDIRQFRQDLLKMSSGDPRTTCTIMGDFFNLSECNDLLFHVQEHRYTFPLIKEMAARHGIEPIYVSLSPEKGKLFQEMFPDGKRSNFYQMAEFEEKYPQSFIEMYKIYFKRIGDNSVNPLDQLIYLGIL